jgi:hypothetical protein
MLMPLGTTKALDAAAPGKAFSIPADLTRTALARRAAILEASAP